MRLVGSLQDRYDASVREYESKLRLAADEARARYEQELQHHLNMHRQTVQQLEER